MNAILHRTAAAVGLLAISAGSAQAQQSPGAVSDVPTAAQAVGRWLYDAQGNTVGSASAAWPTTGAAWSSCSAPASSPAAMR
jgi:hypothetical protein